MSRSDFKKRFFSTGRFIVVLFITLLIAGSCEIIEDIAPYSEDQYEPNDTRAEAAPIDMEANINATVYPEGDEDYYVFTTDNVDQWDRVEISVTNVSEDLEIRMYLYDEDGVEFHSENSGTRGANMSVTYETRGGTYYVRIRSRWTDDIGEYTLRVSNMDFNDQYAPNDSRGEAYDLGVLPVSDIEGILVSGDEEDWFKVTTENDGIWDYVQFDVTDVDDDLEVRFAVFNIDGNEVFAVNSGDRGANLRHTLATRGGVYYIRVTSRWGSVGNGEYTLGVQNLDANDQYEPNDSRNEAYDLGLLPISDINGMIIWTPGDEDWFKFQTDSDDPFTITVSDVGDDLQVNLRIEDEPGNSHTINSGSQGADVVISSDNMTYISPESGKTFYVRVQGRFNGHRGPYTLSIQ